MIRSLPSSFVSFENGKLVLSHQLGFIKFNWTFHAQLSIEKFPKFLYNDMIFPLLRLNNPSGSVDISDSDIQILNQAAVIKQAEPVPPKEDPTKADPVSVLPTSPIIENAPEPLEAVDPATAEQTKRRELEEKLASSNAPKKKKRLL
jgi:hypothetical protein